MEASLARLRELAIAIPRPGCDWEERPRFGPPGVAEQVAAFERAAGFPLSRDLQAFLATCGTVAAMSVQNGYWIGDVVNQAHALASGNYPREVSGELAVPIGSDGGGNIFLQSRGGRVWRWDHETGCVALVAESFADFLDRVAEDWAAYIADTPGWKFLV